MRLCRSEAGRVVGELHQGDLEQQSWIGGVAHLDQHLAETLHRPHDRCRAEAGGLRRHLALALRRQLHELGCHERQEAVAQVADDLFGQGARIAALEHGMGDDRQCPTRIVFDERFDELVEWRDFGCLATAGGDELERRDRVARRAATLAQRPPATRHR